MPRPLPNPALRQPSRLEQVFGFRDKAFRTYMLTKGMAPEKKVELANRMLANDHPVVGFAAASALMEVALAHKETRQSSRVSLGRRLECLKQMGQIWLGSITAFGASQVNTSPKDPLHSEYWALKIRAHIAHAHLPAMHVAARWFSGENVPRPALEMALSEANRQNVETAASVLEASGSSLYAARIGMCRKMLGGLLLRRARPEDMLLMPASFRQVHHAEQRARADHMAISTTPPYRRTMVRVGAAPQEDSHQAPLGFTIDLNRYESLNRRAPIVEALDQVVRHERGQPYNPDVIGRMAAISESLYEQFDAFRAAHESTRPQTGPSQ